jgi:hypothetical protein
VNEITVGEYTYSIGKLDALKQFHVARRLVPVLAAFTRIGEAPTSEGLGVKALLPIAEALSKMSDEETEYIINTCLSVVQRQDSGKLQRIMLQGRFVYEDIKMPDMIKLTSETIMENMGDFFAGLQAVGSKTHSIISLSRVILVIS